MSPQFRVLGWLADVFKAAALVVVVGSVATAVVAVQAELVVVGVAVLAGGAFTALATFSIGSLIDLATACEAHLRTIANDSEWVSTSATPATTP